MDFILESTDINDYLKSNKYIDFYEKTIQQKANEVFAPLSEEKEKIKAAYEYVRDEIHHSGNINSEIVAKRASEVLKYKEGICIAKSLLLAALLRYVGIPAGLCYQRLTVGGMPDSGYIIHGLNAVYLSDEKIWIRLDARGNKQGVNAQFCIHNEKIAYPVRSEYDEVDYPTIYSAPHVLVMKALEKYINRREYSFDIREI